MADYLLVDKPDSLPPLISGRNPVGVDTEFVRERTFFAELCLIQLAAGDDIYCVDPLVGADMSAFWDCLLSRTWVLHSARQDIEVVFQAANRMPAAIFDTQVAAGLLGYAPQLGYANLVSELFGAELAKSHTRADWSKRPLTDALLHYAAEDVEYLLPAHAALGEALDKQGRLEWALEDSAQLLDPVLYEVDPSAAVDRLKAARNLRGRHRAAAARLAVWRETEAVRANRPRQWIARDNLLVALANTLPGTLAELQRIDGMAAGLVRRQGRQLLDIVAASANDDQGYRPPPAPNEAQKDLLKRLQQHVAGCAADLGVAAEVLASRKDLAALALGDPSGSRAVSGWRRQVVGDELLKIAARG